MIIPKNKIYLLKGAIGLRLNYMYEEGNLSDKDRELLNRMHDQCTLVECGHGAIGLTIDTVYKNYSQHDDTGWI